MFVGNALIAKARTLYGQCLKAYDYEQLLKKKSVNEIVIYLKNHPGYQDLLTNVDDNSVHRAQLEELIKKNSFAKIQKIVHFVSLQDSDFYQINVVHREVEVILAMIRSFISYEEQNVIATLPLYFDKYSKLNLEAIVKTHDIQSLMLALGDLPYARILKPYIQLNNQDIDYTMIESDYENYYYRYVKERIETNYKQKLRSELLDVFETRIEMINIIKIYRLKRFYQATNDEIKKVLIPNYSRLSERRINEILSIKDPNEILKYIASSDIAQYLGKQDQIYLEYYADHIKYDLARKNIYYSTKPQKVFLGFMILLEIEVENLTHLIEGVRYQVSEKEIRQILVY